MNLAEQIYAQALILAGEIDLQQSQLLRILCAGADAALAAGVRQDPPDSQARSALITAGSLYAMASFLETEDSRSAGRFSVGDVHVQRTGGGAGAQALRRQADRIAGPYLRDSFAFRRV